MAAPMHVLKKELRKNIRSVLSELSESAVASQSQCSKVNAVMM
jgi:hypothetical protein